LANSQLNITEKQPKIIIFLKPKEKQKSESDEEERKQQIERDQSNESQFGEDDNGSKSHMERVDQSAQDSVINEENKDDREEAKLEEGKEEFLEIEIVFDGGKQRKWRTRWQEEKSELEASIQNKGTAEVYQDYGEKIPKRTLQYWKANPIKENKESKSQFERIDDELFEWFLVTRAQKTL